MLANRSHIKPLKYSTKVSLCQPGQAMEAGERKVFQGGQTDRRAKFGRGGGTDLRGACGRSVGLISE